ncbi:hypothetical protein F3Y22_tig00117026pilonHSYRG00046 [Hibiscus syriacus]|uniref:Uncharacterized protein n=1 Tax=Hibiscus syriacus TaxID=106335 RepID=A0A6A2XG73_HIBSY|nr:hypothetical protein F3Y22_tig00117026pilonHSYRG00046 [Hibiscus syriacus]
MSDNLSVTIYMQSSLSEQLKFVAALRNYRHGVEQSQRNELQLDGCNGGAAASAFVSRRAGKCEVKCIMLRFLLVPLQFGMVLSMRQTMPQGMLFLCHCDG